MYINFFVSCLWFVLITSWCAARCAMQGLVQTLDGLNIRNNPLEFPPPEVLEKGTRKILSFLRRLLKAKSDALQAGTLSPVIVFRLGSNSTFETNSFSPSQSR